MAPQPKISAAGVIDGDVMLLLARDAASAGSFVEADPFKMSGEVAVLWMRGRG